MARARENGTLTNSKRYKEQQEARESNSIGSKAKELAQSAGTLLSNASEALQPASKTVSNVANTATAAVAASINTVNNIKQALSPTGIGYQQSYASGSLQHQSDVYGGLQMPAMDFNGLIPSDLLHPSGLPKISEDELTQGLAEYAGATRAQKLYQAGFKYIEEVGKTKQQYHKAEQSIIKGATEGVKVQQEIVRFDTQNVELATSREKLAHSNERLKQAQITTTALSNETAQLALKFEALEGKRDAEIRSINAQTQDIIQKYLKDSINNGQ